LTVLSGVVTHFHGEAGTAMTIKPKSSTEKMAMWRNKDD
jgi:hypothetical protein